MKTCICETCANLKSMPAEQEGEIILECQFGFPSDDCETCNQDGCDARCDHFASIEETELCTAKCAECGKELQISASEAESDVYCIDCYLSQK